MTSETSASLSGERKLLTFEILENPQTVIDQDAVLKVFAVSPSTLEDGVYIPVGYVSTKSTRVRMLGEFSGEPTGEYAPCNAVKGFVGDGEGLQEDSYDRYAIFWTTNCHSTKTS